MKNKEEREEVQTSRKFRATWFLVKHSTIAAVIVAGSVAITSGVNELDKLFEAKRAEATEWINRKFTRVQVVREIADPESLPVDEIIEQLSTEAGLRPEIIKALAVQESGKYLRTDRVRYEPKLLSRVKPPANLNDIEKQLWASSIGLTQVIYGLHKERCGLKSPADLFNPKISVSCSIIILKANLEAAKRIKSPGRRLWEALRMYNGSGPDAEVYADTVMKRLAEMLLSDLGSGI